MIRLVITTTAVAFFAVFSVIVGEMSRRIDEALEELY